MFITDREMPYMDGYELTRAIIVHDPKAKVVMLTGMATRKDLDSAIDAGCVGTVLKPFDVPTIEKVIAVALQRECAVEPPMGIRLNVLVVTDENTGIVATVALNMAGYKAKAANNPTEAIGASRNGEIDIAIIDFAMRDFDKVLQGIRIKHPSAKIIVIAESEHIVDVEKLEGVSNVIVKPVDYSAWERAVQDATAITPTPRKTKATVLVVDDSEDTRRILEIVITGREHPIKTARDGREALEIYAQGGVELVLSDLEMPIMDGLALLKAIKARNPDAKVVILTASELTAEEKIEIMEAGALQIVAKPVGLDTIERLLADHATI